MADTAPVLLMFRQAEVDDPRRAQARRNAWEAMRLIATLAVIYGAENWTRSGSSAIRSRLGWPRSWICRTAFPRTTSSDASSACWILPSWKPALQRGCSSWP